MANVIKKVKIKKEDDTYTDYIPIGADARNISMSNGYNVQDTIGNINVDEDGNIAEQLAHLKQILQELINILQEDDNISI